MWEETHPKKYFHTINIGKEIDLIKDETLSKKDFINRNMILCNKAIERIILRDPAKWCLLAHAHKIRRYNPVFT